jgi:uncharacterized protein YciI
MFLIIGRYTVPPEQMADHLDGHRAWIGSHVATGHFVAAGPEIPLQGGVVMCVGATRDEIQSWIDEDPYIIHGLAEYDIREYNMVIAAEGATALKS